MAISQISLYKLDLPLVVPYKISFQTFTAFDPMIAVVRDDDGRVGFGEAVITAGYGHETPEGGWKAITAISEDLVGLSIDAAKVRLQPLIASDPQAASILYSALETLEGHAMLSPAGGARVPLLEPIHSFDHAAITDEVEKTIARGFPTLKIKVGFEVEKDLARVAHIQKVVGDRVTMRLDANQGFKADDGRRFAAALDPSGIELFEQPCHMDDWAANIAVAEVSKVPVMMDESIYGLADIDRAAKIKGVGFVKLKLKKMGGLDLLRAGLDHIRSLGMRPVLGDGTATEIACWHEACVAKVAIDNAGENNGFLKFSQRLFKDPLHFENGAIVVPDGWRPEIDEPTLEKLAVAKVKAGASGGIRKAS